MALKRILFSFLLVASYSSLAQGVLDSPVEIARPRSLHSLLVELEKSRPVRFYFLEEWIEFLAVDERQNGKSLKVVLDEVLAGSNISYTFLFNYAVILSKDPAIDLQRESTLRAAAEAKKQIDVVTLGDRKTDYVPGKTVRLRGIIQSETDESRMPGVTIFISNLNVSHRSDANGEFAFTIPSGEHVVHFRHLNYSEKVIDLKAYRNGTVDVVMHETPRMLEEVEVSDQAIVNRRVGESTLKLTDIKRAPTFLGEVDVIKSLQIQSGVTTVGEIASGFNVRGGTVDQNLVLYDGTPIFNTSHALGFFTAFNSDNLSAVSFYRGGIPAEFGGRVSSVLNITSKEGNYRKWSGSGGIGIISSYFSIGGPVLDSTSINVSFRSSYSNWMLRAAESNFKDLNNSSVVFYDGSLKLAHRFSSKTRLTFSAYASHDEFSLADDTLYSWKNLAGSLRLDHTHRDNFFSSLTLSAGQYGYQVQEPDPGNAFKLKYGVFYPSLNYDVSYTGKHAISFGIHNTFYRFDPGELERDSDESSSAQIRMPSEKALESAIYIGDGFDLTDKLFVELGFRLSMYNRIGSATVYQYEEGSPRLPQNTIDSTAYKNGEIVKTYLGPEPRASLRYNIDGQTSVKVGYNRMYQYLHLVTNTAAVTPVDIWQASNSYFKPQIADQLSLGVFRSSKDNMYESFIEGYYKKIENVLDFKDGAQLILNRRLETALLSGTGLSYGTELSLSKVKGRLQGFANYTWSRTLRQTDGANSTESINNGKQYAANSDQPHVVNLNWRYGISRRHFFSGNFTYHTGRPMSVPISSYTVDGVPVADFGDRNTHRIPDYHRLDIAFVIEGNHKIKKPWSGTWVFSFYNVYARRNAYSVFYREQNTRLVPYRLAIVGTIIPSITYTFKF